MGHRPSGWRGIAALAALLAACDASGHRVVVELHTDLRPRLDFDAVRTVLADGDDTERGILPSDDYLGGVRVAELESVPSGAHQLEVALLDATGAVVTVRRVLADVRADSAVSILIASDCVGASCPRGGDHPSATECLGGYCVPVGCVRLGDPECEGYLPECDRASDCGAPTDCADARCLDGVCLSEPADERCEPGWYCDVFDGCRPREPSADSGVPESDAGPADAGAPDGGPPCPGGCDDGEPCTDDVCTPGVGCEHVPNDAPCDDGVFCNGPDTCSAGACAVHAGDPCTGATVCDPGAGACVGCVVTSDCPAPVNGPWSGCEGFADACDQTGEQTRTVTDYTCSSGVCAPAPRSEMRACMRATDGISCGASTCPAWGPCAGFTSGCDETGQQARDCTDRVCAAGACSDVTRPETQACSRTVCAPGSTRPCGTDRIETCSADCTWCSCLPDTGVAGCGGAIGGWSGCRGTGCDVCSERVSAYPCYFANHPTCRANDACGGMYYPCNAKCPAPTDADLCMCPSTAGEWVGCTSDGCEVCADRVSGHACYFINHPECDSSATCGGSYQRCNTLCPAPTAADLGSST